VEELLARVRAVLRRTQYAAHESVAGLRSTVTIGDLSVDLAQHLVTMRGEEVPTTPVEYRLLAYLTQNAGRVVTQDLLLEHVWGPEYVGESHMLQVNINRLRHKLEPDPSAPRYLLTKVGVGYLIPAHPIV
jgi:DNA-binding response OmpR family regulator